MKRLFIILLMFASLTAGATKYYCAPTTATPAGSDANAGTLAAPFFTLEKAWTVITSGDTVYMRGGTYSYTETQRIEGESGTAENLINIWAYPGEIPIITKGTPFTYYYAEAVNFIGDYVHWKGIEITGHTQLTSLRPIGLRSYNSSNCIFENMNIHHNGGGMLIKENAGGVCTGNLVLNSDFHHNYDPFTTIAYGDADGLVINEVTHTTSINTIRGCRSWSNSDDGYDFWNNHGTVYIEDSWAFSNGYREDGTTVGGDGNGYKLGNITEDLDARRRKLTNCIAAINYYRGFSQNVVGYIMPVEVYNCASYGNGATPADGLGYQFQWANEGTLTNIFRNNFSLSDKAAISKETWDISDHNTWDGAVTVTSADFVSVDATQLDNTRQSDGSLPVIEFLHLASGSDLINAGVYVGLDYNGTAPDIGAFESTEGVKGFAKTSSTKFGRSASGNFVKL